ncbi:MAG: Mov34/MPN/PAD-1 family protein [Vicinamibacterales bacterium]
MTRLKNRLAGAERANPVSQVHFWKSPPGAAVEVSLVAHLDVYATIHQHSVESLPNETGGFLLGRVAHDPLRGSWHIEVDETLPVEPLSQDPVHFSFTWRDVDRVRNHRETQGKALIGWYHTHPDIGIFLSETDLEKTHRVLFNEPFQLALVYDPVRSRAGYFFWEGVQVIDASQASWREFEIAFADEAPQDAAVEAAADDPGVAADVPATDPVPPAVPDPEPPVAQTDDTEGDGSRS